MRIFTILKATIFLTSLFQKFKSKASITKTFFIHKKLKTKDLKSALLPNIMTKPSKKKDKKKRF